MICSIGCRAAYEAVRPDGRPSKPAGSPAFLTKDAAVERVRAIAGKLDAVFILEGAPAAIGHDSRLTIALPISAVIDVSRDEDLRDLRYSELCGCMSIFYVASGYNTSQMVPCSNHKTSGAEPERTEFVGRARRALGIDAIRFRPASVPAASSPESKA